MKFSRKTGMEDDDDDALGSDPDAPEPEFMTPGKAAKSKSRQRKSARRGYLDGQMLIAMSTPSSGTR